ncbi:hypothetical protein BGX20_003141, partial [Mortierella sp. AD010]
MTDDFLSILYQATLSMTPKDTSRPTSRPSLTTLLVTDLSVGVSSLLTTTTTTMDKKKTVGSLSRQAVAKKA